MAVGISGGILDKDSLFLEEDVGRKGELWTLPCFFGHRVRTDPTCSAHWFESSQWVQRHTHWTVIYNVASTFVDRVFLSFLDSKEDWWSLEWCHFQFILPERWEELYQSAARTRHGPAWGSAEDERVQLKRYDCETAAVRVGPFHRPSIRLTLPNEI